ncbi:MAG TPA: ATP synthase F1 subunit gamma [Polyangiaceae bacterium]|nr:ATP synthase F1 subunit gamma [Polyangiaceae bacterium]
MANLKEIRKRISSVKSTQKITRAMKMVAGARLNRAQQRILALRPYAVKTHQVLADITRSVEEVVVGDGEVIDPIALEQPLLGRRRARHVLFLVITSDRGLCGAFNGNIGKAAMQAWREAEAQGQRVSIATIGRRGRDFLRRRGAPTVHDFRGIWDRLGVESAREVARVLLDPFLAGEVDSIRIVYNEFKSAMSQRVVNEALLPVTPPPGGESPAATPQEFIFEPDRAALLARLAPMYVEISVLRALYESMASELGARMTAMDAATKNAEEMIGKLTLQYNRARQAAITTELMEIIGGANALQEG